MARKLDNFAELYGTGDAYQGVPYTPKEYVDNREALFQNALANIEQEKFVKPKETANRDKLLANAISNAKDEKLKKPTETPVVPKTDDDTKTPETEVSNSDTGVETPSADAAFDYTQIELSKIKTPVDDPLKMIINDYMNRDSFSYDPNSDMLYQNYLSAMQNAGQMAMKDTMGQAAALTGGYGSTYATAAGQGAYNNYLQNANDNLADYYNIAMNKYNQEGNEMLNRYNLLNGIRKDYINEETGNSNAVAQDTMTDTQKYNYLNDLLEARNQGESEFEQMLQRLDDAYNLSDEFLKELHDLIESYGSTTYTKTGNPLFKKWDSYVDQDDNEISDATLKQLVKEGVITEDQYKKITKMKKNESYTVSK